MDKEILSIRLSADGLSFWTETQADKRTGSAVDFSLCREGLDKRSAVQDALSTYKGILTSRGLELPVTKKLYADTLLSVLVPQEIFCEREAVCYLVENGIDPRSGHYTVCSRPVCGTVSVIHLEKETVEALGDALGRFEVAHLLQYNLEKEATGPSQEPHIRVYSTPEHCHITGFDRKGLTTAESYPAASATDLTYYLSCIMAAYRIPESSTVLVDGYKAEETASILSHRFPNVKCG